MFGSAPRPKLADLRKYVRAVDAHFLHKVSGLTVARPTRMWVNNECKVAKKMHLRWRKRPKELAGGRPKQKLVDKSRRIRPLRRRVMKKTSVQMVESGEEAAPLAHPFFPPRGFSWACFSFIFHASHFLKKKNSRLTTKSRAIQCIVPACVCILVSACVCVCL